MPEIVKYEDLLFEKYIDNKIIKSAIKVISTKINREYKNKKLQIVGLLDGCAPTLTDLTKYLNINYCIYNIKITSDIKTSFEIFKHFFA